MESPDRTEDLRTLLREIDSFEKLELICLLTRRGDAAMSAAAIAEALQLEPRALAEVTRELEQAGVVERTTDGGWRSAPVSREQHRELARLYEQDDETRLLVIRSLSQFAMARIRTTAAHAFNPLARRRPSTEDLE